MNKSGGGDKEEWDRIKTFITYLFIVLFFEPKEYIVFLKKTPPKTFHVLENKDCLRFENKSFVNFLKLKKLK